MDAEWPFAQRLLLLPLLPGDLVPHAPVLGTLDHRYIRGNGAGVRERHGVDTVANTLLAYAAVSMRSCQARRVSDGVR